VRILVSGMIAGVPRQGGATWAVLQYVLGLRQLGHHVVFVEQVDSLDESAPYFDDVVQRFGLSAALLERGSYRSHGLDQRRLRTGYDVLFNLSGLLVDDALLLSADTCVFVDLDPCFTQLWFKANGIDPGFDRHDRFATVGASLGTPACTVPTCGLDWIATPQPVVLEHWPLATRLEHRAATTVGHWRGYGSIHYDGVHYGQRAHSMRPLLDLAARTGNDFLLALAIDPGEHDDLAALDRHGWKLIDPACAAGTPDDYRSFVQGSWAEFGVAKLGYVAARCGWFSDRSACYLASGRPVVAQETGFSDWLPTGEGLFAYSTTDEAATAFRQVGADYPRHRAAARALAEDIFSSSRVLTELLECL
jgi:hypothetical protein